VFTTGTGWNFFDLFSHLRSTGSVNGFEIFGNPAGVTMADDFNITAAAGDSRAGYVWPAARRAEHNRDSGAAPRGLTSERKLRDCRPARHTRKRILAAGLVAVEPKRMRPCSGMYLEGRRDHGDVVFVSIGQCIREECIRFALRSSGAEKQQVKSEVIIFCAGRLAGAVSFLRPVKTGRSPLTRLVLDGNHDRGGSRGVDYRGR